MRYCNECGAQIRDDSMFCSLCGAKVITVENTQVSSQQAGDMPQGYVPPQQPVGTPQGYAPPQQAGGMSQGQYPTYQLPPQNLPMQTGISTDKDSQKSSPKKKTAIIVSIASVFLIAIIAVIVVFVLSDKDDSSDGAYSSTDFAANSDDKKEDKIEENSTTEAPTTEAVVIDTSYNGLLNNLSNLNSVNIRFVSSDVSDFPNVKAYFTVEDSAGNAVSLTSPNVAIKEIVSNGAEVEREIKSFEKLEGREGISIELVADKSGSMEGDIYTMQTIMSEFVNALDYDSGDKVELIAFDSYVMYMCTYTQDTSLLNNGINNMTTYGETALYDALYEAVLNAGSQEGARCVIAFTDGMDNCSIHTSEEVINLANTYSIPIFIIGTYNGDYSLYSDITGRTGGIYWDIDSVSDMSAILDSIYTKEKNMYCLEYVSDASTDAYAQRSISCVMSDDTYGASIDTSFSATATLEKAHHESRYELIVDDISWSEANEACLRKGGHLITITSQEEMDQAVALAEGANLRFIWMGGYTSVRNDDAYGHWITGESFEFTAWYPGEPSRTDKDGADEMYLMLWQVEGEWSWNDQRNDPAKDTGLSYFQGKVGYICEYED
ncbi:MAG: VWA domain-containing protein [Lachnospiraceae bacterium]|nr:VWA domain-containing protein [Lachnospiraceae bacterium]